MRTKNHAFFRRTVCRAGLIVAALGGLQIAHAQAPDQYYPAGRNAFDAMGQRIAGNSTQFGMHLTGAGTTSTSVSPTNLSGWTPASNYGVKQAATGATYTIGGKFTGSVAGQRLALTAASTATRAGILDGAGMLISGLVPVGGAVLKGLLLAAQMKTIMDAVNAQINTQANGGLDTANPFLVPETLDGYVYFENGNETTGPFYYSAVSLGQKLHDAFLKANPYMENRGGCSQSPVNAVVVDCPVHNFYSEDPATQNITYAVGRKISTSQLMKGTNWDGLRERLVSKNVDLGPLVQWQLDAAKRSEENGITPTWTLPVTAPVITGPASLEPTTKTERRTWNETGPDGVTRQKTETTTTTTANPVNYNKDTVKVVPQETVTKQTTTTNPDGSTTTQTDTTTSQSETDKPTTDNPESDLCKLHPDILACSKPELDTPDGEIPKTQKEVTYQEESIWGSGSCPADRIMTLHTGQQMKVWDFQKTCEAVNMGIAPIFLLCSVYSAFLILALGVKDGV